MKTSPNKYNDAVKEVANFDYIFDIPLNNLLLSITKRITEDGKNTNGIKIGDYSKSYKKKRKASGRNVDKVNLMWSGKTIRKLQVYNNEIGFVIEKDKNYIRGYEIYKKMDIVAPTENEFKELEKDIFKQLENRK